LPPKTGRLSFFDRKIAENSVNEMEMLKRYNLRCFVNVIGTKQSVGFFGNFQLNQSKIIYVQAIRIRVNIFSLNKTVSF
jgi:hypothetical protein